MSNMNEVPQDAMAEVNPHPNLNAVGFRLTIDRVGHEPLVMLTPQGGNNTTGIRFEPVVLSSEAGSLIAELRDELDERGIDIDILSKNLAQMQRDSDFYRGLIVRCGEAIGREAYVCDDGSISNSVLALKVPELVEELVKASRYPKNRFLRALRILITGK